MTRSTLRFDKQRAEVGVGSKSFIENIKAKLGILAKDCTVAGLRDSYQLREERVAFNSNFTLENGVFS